jgi:hypothetical protein
VSPDWLTYCLGLPGPNLDYVTPSFLEGTVALHPISNGDSGPSCFVSASSHRHGSRTFCSASFHPWKSHHVTTGSRASTYVVPWSLWQGLVVVVVVPTYVTPSQREGDWHRLSRHLQLRAVSPPTRWTGLCGAPTIAPYRPRQQPVQTCRSPRLGMAAHLRFQGLPLLALCLCTVPRPKGPVYRRRGCWPFVYVMPQDVAVYRHAGHSSLTLWGTFRATQAMPGRDVLAAAVLACLACKSRELIRDVPHHGQTSVGRAHRHSVSS